MARFSGYGDRCESGSSGVCDGNVVTTVTNLASTATALKVPANGITSCKVRLKIY